MSDGLREAWLVLHVRYPSFRARRELIVDWLPRLAGRDNGPWYFVDTDVPSAGGSGAATGMEIAIRSATEDRSEEERQQVLYECLGRALVTSIIRAESSLAVQSSFFPAGVQPACYRAALAVGSRRASLLLRGRLAPAVDGVSGHVVRAELLYTHSALVPPSAGIATLGWHAAWLEHLAGDAETAATREDEREMGGASPPLTRATARYRGDDCYGNLRAQLTRHAKEVAQQIRDAGVKHGWRAENIRAAIVARLAHLQTVRLWGPGMPRLLGREAAHLRALQRDGLGR